MARPRLDAEQSKTIILDAAERLIERGDPAAVNTRTVAIEAGLKPPLVHYHFATTENLLLASYQRSAERSETLLQAALESERPLHALWRYNADPKRATLATAFMALAQQHPSIRAAMALNVTRFRQRQAARLRDSSTALPPAFGCSPEVLAMLIAAVGRAFVMEGSIGISDGHAEMRTFVDVLLDAAEPPRPEDRSVSTKKWPDGETPSGQ